MVELNPAVFQKRIGEIALELELISPEVQARMVEVQARAIALVLHGKAVPPVAELADDAKWAQIAGQAGVLPEKMETARTLANSPQAITAPGVPPSGAILAAIPGGVSHEVKDALLAAQASEHALQVLDNAGKPGQSYNDAELQSYFQQLDQEMPHVGRRGESSIVQKAQQAYKNALQYNAMEHHEDCNVLPHQDPSVQNDRAFLKATLPQMAATTYRLAAINLGIHAAELAKQNAPQAESVAKVADGMLTMLVNQRGVAPVTEEELATFASKKNLQETVRTASGQTEATQDETQKWAKKIAGDKGQNPSGLVL